MASLEELRAERIAKLERLKKAGMNAYPVESKRDMTLERALEDFSKLSKRKGGVTLAGRVRAIRGQGAIIFFDLDDGTGSFQGLLKEDKVAPELFALFRDTVDLGDIIEVSGTLFITKRKEKTIEVGEWRMLSKSLRPLPDKWHGLQDTEERFRRRYLDTLMSKESKERFFMRSRLITLIREALDKTGYLEVETPILQALAGGALAEPFKTHHNALDIDLYLRIAPELYLKELLVGGFPKVYELSRNFRNEGIDTTHNPEFTMLEFYESYSDAARQMDFVEKLVRSLVRSIFKKTEFPHSDGVIDLKKPFARVPFFELLKRYALIVDTEIGMDELKLKAAQLGVDVAPHDSREKILDAIYKKTVRPKLVEPTFIVDYPAAMNPFAKRQEANPKLIDRFQLVMGGMEIVNAFSEVNDPLDQRERYAEQEKKRKGGEKDISPSDEEYLEALEYGLPPAGGVGIGIDRLAMLMTNTQNIREVILFPTMRPRG